jgi:hypothetical protein
VVLELSKALQPIATRLESGQALALLEELGLKIPANVVTPALSSAFSSVATSAQALPQQTQDLITAIEGGDALQIISKGLPLAQSAVSLITSFDTIATQLGAIGSIPGLSPADLAAFVAALPERLADTILFEYLRSYHTLIFSLLALFGIVEQTPQNVGSTDPLQPPFSKKSLRLDRLGTLFKSPDQLIHDLYGWGDPTFNSDLALQRIAALLTALNVPVTHFVLPGAPPRPAIEVCVLTISPTQGLTPQGLEATIMLSVPDGTEFDIPIAEGWQAELAAQGQLSASVGLRVQPPANVTLIPPSGSVQGQLTAGIARVPVSPASTIVLLGVAGGSGLTAQRIGLGFVSGFQWDSGSGQAKGDFGFAGEIKGGKLHIDTSQSDGFLGTILSGLSVDAGFDIGFGWTTAKSFYFTGSTTLQIQLPSHISLGPIELSAITISVGLQGGSFPIGLSTDIAANLGPLQASVEQIGVSVDLSFPSNGRGNAGPLQIGFGFKPPSGAGLSIDTGIVVGGGFLYFDPDKGEYAGVAELSIADVVTVKAIGLITTKMPDGTSGFSLLLILTTDFPPIQLGFGFTLNAVGGLLGLNRSVQLDVLRDGVRTGAVDDIMFPTDIIANAPRIISDLKAIFPPQQNVFLVGPMAQFGWGDPSLVTLSLGIIVEIPPGNIAILGVLRVALPTEDEALILIQVAFLGILDFDEQLFSFDASLYDSHILFMTLEGDMAVRLKWGDNAAFILSVGGFHPAFHPPDGLHLPASMKRLSISILDYDWAKIKVNCYFAVTSNTVQFGAHLYLFFGVDAANITGQLGLDVLFQFSPFMFIAQMSGSLSISVFGMDLLSISLNFQLSGPTPWEAKGTGSLSILFFSVDVSFDVTWGDKKDTSLPPIDVMPIFLGEINKQSNWTALPPPSANLLVTLRAVDPSLLVLHPFGSLTLSQRALPLNLKLDKVGNQQPDDVNQVDIRGVASAGTGLPVNDHQEQFAIAQYQNMSDSDKLSRPSYQDIKGGVTIGSSDSALSSKMTRRTINYDVTIIDKDPQQPLLIGRIAALSGLFHPFLASNAAARSPLSYTGKTQLKPFTDTIAVDQEGYAVSNTSDNKPVSANSSFSSEAMARDYMNSQVASNPSQAGAMHVLPNSEVNAP